MIGPKEQSSQKPSSWSMLKWTGCLNIWWSFCWSRMNTGKLIGLSAMLWDTNSDVLNIAGLSEFSDLRVLAKLTSCLFWPIIHRPRNLHLPPKRNHPNTLDTQRLVWALMLQMRERYYLVCNTADYGAMITRIQLCQQHAHSGFMWLAVKWTKDGVSEFVPVTGWWIPRWLFV